MTWAASPGYGQRVALGPAQRDVLDVVLRMTTHGRRPSLTLGRLAALTGRPVSSVHDALGRLRALGLIGCAARMGRHGGHRLWRVRRSAGRTLDVDAHRRAIARMVRRFGARVSQAAVTPGGVITAAHGSGLSGSSGPDPSITSRPSSGRGMQPATGSAPGPLPDAEPDTPWYEKPPRLVAPAGETFAEKMRRYGLRPELMEDAPDGT